MIRRWLARRLTPLLWRLFPSRQAAAMREYALIEKDSGCQILDALPLVEDAELRARLFQQVLEEFHHSDLFEGACREVSSKPLGTPVVTRDSLVSAEPGSDALLDLIAYVHVGEAAVDKDFEAYAGGAFAAPIARAFALARADERNHVGDSRRMLEPFAAGDPGRVTRALLKARLLRGWRSYVQTMSAIGGLPLALLLAGLYALSGLLKGPSRGRLALTAQQQLEIMREQWRRAAAR